MVNPADNNPDNNRSITTGLVAIVALHLLLVMWHGAAHLEIPVALSLLQNLFVAVVISLLPLVGAGMLWSRHRRTGAGLIALSMFGAFVFGVVNHFMLESPDYVVSVPAHAWRHAFVLSAPLLAASEAVGTVLGVIGWRGYAKPGDQP